jgi:thioredoxin-dependent peroxiredoxin
MKTLRLNQAISIVFLVFFLLSPFKAFANTAIKSSDILKVGKPLPNARIMKYGDLEMDINDLKGNIKIISIVPKLNAPVCDKQTHKFSETNGGLDKEIDIITLSTNTVEDQHQFAKKTKIHNIIFLSDDPTYQFGKKTGLLIEGLGILKRTVIVVDENNVIRYVDFVPGGGLPNIKKSLEAAKRLLQNSKSKS